MPESKPGGRGSPTGSATKGQSGLPCWMRFRPYQQPPIDYRGEDSCRQWRPDAGERMASGDQARAEGQQPDRRRARLRPDRQTEGDDRERQHSPVTPWPGGQHRERDAHSGPGRPAQVSIEAGDGVGDDRHASEGDHGKGRVRAARPGRSGGGDDGEAEEDHAEGPPQQDRSDVAGQSSVPGQQNLVRQGVVAHRKRVHDLLDRPRVAAVDPDRRLREVVQGGIDVERGLDQHQ